MSASRHLNPQQFYHASYEEHAPGTILKPQHKKYPEGESWRGSRVWLAASPEHAREWSTGGVNVYEVVPHHTPELHSDLTDFDYNAMPSAGAIFNQYHTSGAKVKRKIEEK